MKWKAFVADYLTFSRKERIGILVLSGLILAIFFLPLIITNQASSSSIIADTVWLAAVRKLEIKEAEKPKMPQDLAVNNEPSYQFDRSVSPQPTLFYFDPNTISGDDWKRLGLRDKTIRTIQNYLSKGGHFKKPEDLQKIFGLSPKDYERLVPFVRIENKTAETDSFTEAKKEYESKRSTPSIIDINTADTTAFIALPGIGNKLAARIVNFREKLGGFHSINQISETFGLPDTTFQKIKHYLKLENTSIRKINLNTATVDELKAHPYIRYNIANAIVAYRNEHGSFGKVEDIKKVMVVTEEVYTKIQPYLIIGH